jgi:hypothetical protein
MSRIFDFFGIYTALHAVAVVYFQTARRTGRTTHMVMSLKTGDRVIFTNPAEARRVLDIARKRCVDIECIVINPLNAPNELRRLQRSKGRTIFDHTWLERRYLDSLESEACWIAEHEKQLSATDADIPMPVASWKGIER